MIILDTNIISELMKPSPVASVISWIDNQDAMQLFITSVTIAEISYGITVLSEGNRKQILGESFKKVLSEAFKHRILSFDENAAYTYGKIMAHRKLLGRPLSILDGQIAAITITNNFLLATRNIRDFSDCEIELINPFDLK